jgi:hypothetical protein
VQKVGASFVMKKVSDYVMAPPKAAESEEVTGVADEGVVDLEGQVITDEDGQRLGTARRVANVAVYVITGSRARLEDQLKSAISDPEGRVFFHHAEDGQLTGLIYVPDQSDQPAPVAATRADDI